MIFPHKFIALFYCLASASALAQSPGTQLWEFVATGRIGSSPALGTNGVVYFGCNNRVFYALNAGTGVKLWEYETGSGIQSSPAIGFDGALYFGSDDFKVYALNPDGSKRWGFTTGGPVKSSPAIGIDGTIYIGSDDFNLYALRPDGSEKWRFATDGKVSNGTAVGGDGTIYFGSEDMNFYALETNGALRWRTNLAAQYPREAGYFPLSPTIGTDRTIYIHVHGRPVFAVNPNGSVQWSTQRGLQRTVPALGSDGTIYAADSSELVAIEPDGYERWRCNLGHYSNSGPAVGADGTIYVITDDSRLHAVSSSGSLRWTYGNPFFRGYLQTSCPLISANGVVYVGLGTKLVAVMGTGGGLADSPWPMFQKNPAHTARNQVASPNAPATPALAIHTLPGLTITGSVGHNHRIEYRESFGDTNTWLTLTNIILPASPWLFVDTQATGPRRFYRAVAE